MKYAVVKKNKNTKDVVYLCSGYVWVQQEVIAEHSPMLYDSNAEAQKEMWLYAGDAIEKFDDDQTTI